MRGGSRFYVNPETRVTAPGVTSIIGMLPKPFLRFWSTKMTAELAVDSLPFIQEMADTAGRDAAVDYLKGASTRYTKVRANVGSDAHDLFERMIRGEVIESVHPDLIRYRDNFAEFLDVVQPKLIGAEDVAWSDEHNYAGSFDAVLEVLLSVDSAGNTVIDLEGGEPTLIMDDWKTSKATYADVALQMSAYSNADRIIRSDGSHVPMPEFGGAAVLHITPDQWAFKPVRADEAVFEFFLALRKIFDWDREFSKDVIGRAIASGGRKLTTGTQRRGK